MKKISYAGESFVTSDGVADALLRFVAALGASHTSAAVEVPALLPSEQVELLRLVVGPASEILSRPEEPSNPHDLTDAAGADMRNAEARLDASTDALTVSRNVVYAQPNGFGEYDFEGLE